MKNIRALIILFFFLSLLSLIQLPKFFTYDTIEFRAEAKEIERDEDDEEEEDDDEDERNESDTEYKAEEQIIYVNETVPAPPVTSTVELIDPAYTVDTDGDKLVDPLDPHPNISEVEFFTDDDKDGVANAYDEHQGENDFIYIQFIDENQNGIFDTLETQ